MNIVYKEEFLWLCYWLENECTFQKNTYAIIEKHSLDRFIFTTPLGHVDLCDSCGLCVRNVRILTNCILPLLLELSHQQYD